MSRITVHDKGCLAPFRAHRHICSLLVQVGHHVVLVEELLGLFHHDARAAQLLIKDIFVVEEAVIWHARCRGALRREVAWVVERWRFLLQWRGRVDNLS